MAYESGHLLARGHLIRICDNTYKYYLIKHCVSIFFYDWLCTVIPHIVHLNHLKYSENYTNVQPVLAIVGQKLSNLSLD